MSAKEKFRCPSCHEWHDDQDEAEDCCDIEVKRGWECSECSEVYEWYEKEKAEKCCADKPSIIVFTAPRCLCGQRPTYEDVRDSQLVGTLIRCRDCLLKIDRNLVAA